MSAEQDRILNAGRKVIEFTVKGLDDLKIHMRPLNVAEFQKVRALASEAKGDAGKLNECSMYLVACSICDASGARVFIDAEVSKLEAMVGRGLDEISLKAQQLNGMTTETRDETAKK